MLLWLQGWNFKLSVEGWLHQCALLNCATTSHVFKNQVQTHFNYWLDFFLSQENKSLIIFFDNQTFNVHRPLFNAQVCIDGGIACCASQVLVFSVGDVLSCSVVSVLLRQTKVNKEQLTERERTHCGYRPVTPHRAVITIQKFTRSEDAQNDFLHLRQKLAESCCKTRMSKTLLHWLARSLCRH